MSTATPGATRAATADVSQRSFGELMGEVTQDLSTLMRQEIELAKAEVKEGAVKAGKAGGMFTSAGVAGHMVLVFLSVALWWGLSNVMDGSWAALIVAALWAIVGAILYSRARAQLKQFKGMPQTVSTVKEIPDALTPDRGVNP